MSNPTVFNNPQDSDVILKCGDHHIYAHRAFLRAWSPFFHRTFNSQFSVAKSPIFVIDPVDSGDYEPLCVLLKHVYGMPLVEHPNCFMANMDRKEYLGFYFKIYALADKYDFPAVRLAVIDNLYGHRESGELCESVLPGITEQIACLCGPDAPQLADPALRDFFFDWIVNNFDSISADRNFAAKLEDGSLLDAELTTKLLFQLGERLRGLIKATRRI